MKTLEPRTRILLVDDHALFRAGAARLLDAEPGFEIAGCCGSIEEALTLLRSTPVDLVLLDVDLGKERGFQFFQPARAGGFTGKILIVAGVVGPFEARRLMQNDVAGIFLKQNPPGLLLEAIQAIMSGEPFIDPVLRESMNEIPRAGTAREELTARDLAVWAGVVEGLSNKEIASRVHISEALVKVTLQQLFDKYGVRSRSQLVRIALEQQALGR